MFTKVRDSLAENWLTMAIRTLEANRPLQKGLRHVRYHTTRCPARRNKGIAMRFQFEQAFEQACANVQTMYRDERKVQGHILIGLEGGPIVATAFAWANKPEKARLFHRLAREYQGRAEFYIYATEVWGVSGPNGQGRRVKIARIVGMNRELKTLSRCWEIEQEPVTQFVEKEDLVRTREPLHELLFKRLPSFKPA